jgi:PAS domain S-box-containing protein
VTPIQTPTTAAGPVPLDAAGGVGLRPGGAAAAAAPEPGADAAIDASAVASEEEAVLALVARTSDAGVLITDPEDRVVFANRGFERISGYSFAELKGRQPRTLLHGPGTDEAARAKLREAVARRRPAKVEIVNYRKDGTPYWVEVSMVPVRNAVGGEDRLVYIEQEISAKREAMERLQSAESQLRSVFESITEHAVLLLDTRGYIQRLNAANTTLTGWPVTALRLRPVWELKRGRGMRARFQRLLAAAALDKVTGSTRLVQRDGTRCWLRWSLTPLRGSDGGLDGYVMVAHDITAEREAARSREVARQHAEELARSKSSFLATMSHEIRTPLNGVLGLARLLLDEQLSEPQRRLATTLLASAESLLTVVNDVLDYSKLEAGRMTLSPAPVAVADVVRGVVAILEVGARSKGLRLTATIDETVPPFIVGDAGRLRQILLNLAGNAVKFTGRGQVTITVSATDGAEPRLRFAVKDTGIGIAPEDQHRLFRMFEQVDNSATRRAGGTGLGLAISLQLAQLMDGSIRVESALGVGSTFTLDVPCVAADAIPLSAVPSTPLRRFRGVKVLMVDDNPVNQLVGKLMLEREGCEVGLASDGEEALAMLAASRWDLVLMDGHMPGLDGYEATRRLRAQEAAGGQPRTVVVACSASAFPEDRQRALSAGMDDALPKPIAPEALAALLERWTPGEDERPIEETTQTRMPRLVRAQLLEPSRLEVLRRLDVTGQAVTTITNSFIESAPGRSQALRDALGRGDRDALEQHAHALRGSAAQLGAVAVEDAARAVEQAAHNTDDVSLYPLLTALEQALTETVLALRLGNAA